MNIKRFHHKTHNSDQSLLTISQHLEILLQIFVCKFQWEVLNVHRHQYQQCRQIDKIQHGCK